jgi:integrase
MRHPKPFYRKQKKAWYVQIRGRRISLGKDEKEAWKRYHQIMADDQPVEESTATIEEILERFLDWVKEHRKPATYGKSRHLLKQFARHAGLRTRVMSLNGADLTHWVESEKTWNSTTRNEGIGAVIRCFNWAVERKHLTRNPVNKVPDKPKRKRREVVFSDEDWKELRGYVKDQSFGDLLDFMHETGCRPIEARTMEAKHVDLQNGIVMLWPSEAKGERTERVIFLTDKAEEICRRLMKEHPTGPLILNTQGRPFTKNSVNCRFQRLKKKLGKRAFAYAIRHTFATERLKAGMDSLTVSQLMGHTDVSTLAKSYQHLARNPEYLKQQANRRLKRH